MVRYQERVAGRMSQVSTVRGPVDVADLGPTYMHEHIFVLTADVQQNYPGEWGSEDARITDAVTKLGALAAQGARRMGQRGRPDHGRGDQAGRAGRPGRPHDRRPDRGRPG